MKKSQVDHPFVWICDNLPFCLDKFTQLTGFTDHCKFRDFLEKPIKLSHQIQLHGIKIHTSDALAGLKQSKVQSKVTSLKNLALNQYLERVRTLDDFLNLPDSLLPSFMKLAFKCYWMPIIIRYSFSSDSHVGSESSSFANIVSFLATPAVFIRLNRLCRDLFIYIVSWVQHSHIVLSKKLKRLYFPTRVSMKPSHAFSEVLVKQVQNLIVQEPDNRNNYKFAIEVAQFLMESSEYDHAMKAGKLAAKFSSESRLQYTAYCIILKCVNSQHSYEDASIETNQVIEASLALLQKLDSCKIRTSAESSDKTAWTEPKVGGTSSNSEESSIFSKPVFNVDCEFLERLFREEYSNNVIYSSLDESANFQLPFMTDRQEAEEEFDGFLIMRGLQPGPRVSLSDDDEEEDVLEETPSTTTTTQSDSSIDDYTLNATPLSVDSPAFSCSNLVTADSNNGFNHFFINSNDTGFTANLDLSESNFDSTGYLHCQLAFYFHTMCQLDRAMQHTRWALIDTQHILQEGKMPADPDTLVELLRLLNKLAFFKRDLSLSSKLLTMAITLATQYQRRPVCIRLLLEYANLLMLRDQSGQALRVLNKAIKTLVDFLPCPSVLLAQLLEEVAYAYYVLNYANGNFNFALNLINLACLVLVHLVLEPKARRGSLTPASGGNMSLSPFLNSAHVCQATINRVRALILEEMAVEDNLETRSSACLKYAVRLHLSARSTYIKNFGLYNLQTAKHFGNLGRLYQSLGHYELAEKMHILAIDVKMRILGGNDPDLGLSLGHLASLYTFDMMKLEEGVHLHLLSIQINTRHYGEAYSGLEFDYRGLQRAYTLLGDARSANHYGDLYIEWQALRQNLMRESQQHAQESLEPKWKVKPETMANLGGICTQSLATKAILVEYTQLTKETFNHLESMFWPQSAKLAKDGLTDEQVNSLILTLANLGVQSNEGTTNNRPLGHN